jgi:hypothetical protein
LTLQEIPADQHASERQKCLVHICSFFIPQAKTTELVHPREGAFHDPAPSSQTAAVFRIAHCEQRQDVAGTQSTTDVLCVVCPVPQYAIRATARPTPQSVRAYYESGKMPIVVSGDDTNQVTFDLTVVDAPPPPPPARATMTMISGNIKK